MLWFGGITATRSLGMAQLGKTMTEGGTCSRSRRFCWRSQRAEKKQDVWRKSSWRLSEDYPESYSNTAEYRKAMGRIILHRCIPDPASLCVCARHLFQTKPSSYSVLE